MEWLIALIALTAMEIVLGIDNIVFIAILAGNLPEEKQARARRLGLGAALVTRILLLLALSWILGLKEPMFELAQFGIPESWLAATVSESSHVAEINQVSARDLILLAGGLFLIGKSVHEIHSKIEGAGEEHASSAQVAGMLGVVMQIGLLDIVFSLDSVITAVGMVSEDKLWVMITAIVLAMVVMVIFADMVSHFVERHPTLKMLALSFLILIGVMLVAESIGTPVNKGYIYFAMAFSIVVEFLNLQIRKAHRAVGASQQA